METKGLFTQQTNTSFVISYYLTNDTRVWVAYKNALRKHCQYLNRKTEKSWHGPLSLLTASSLIFFKQLNTVRNGYIALPIFFFRPLFITLFFNKDYFQYLLLKLKTTIGRGEQRSSAVYVLFIQPVPFCFAFVFLCSLNLYTKLPFKLYINHSCLSFSEQLKFASQQFEKWYISLSEC